MEPLSEMLALLKPTSYISPGLDVGGAWALHFPAHHGIKFNAVVRGSCWVAVEGCSGTSHSVEQGDCFLLASGRPFTLASDLSLTARDASPLYASGCDDFVRYQGGGDFMLVGGRFGFAGGYTQALLGNLPAVISVCSSSDEAAVLRWTLDLFSQEIHGGRPGGSLIAEHLAHIMLIQILRLHLSAIGSAGTGWLYALNDPQLSASIVAMNAALARHWTLDELSRIAGMSRSAFAEKFKRIVGSSPMQYLTEWRMRTAAHRLRTTQSDAASIANEVGYTSQAAFSTAFKKAMGKSPTMHRRTP